MRLGSAKISYKVLDKVIADKSITSKEIDVFLWLALRQSHDGIISYVKYKEVCGDIGISYQEYYDCIYSLESSNYITILSRHNFNGWNILINNNCFSDDKDDKKGYLKINLNFLFNKFFIRLRANEKKLILIIIKKFRMTTFNISIKTISEWLNLDNFQLIRSYIDNLKSLFNINQLKNKDKNKEDKKNIIFSFNANNAEVIEDFEESVANIFLEYDFRSKFRASKTKYTEEDMKDLLELANQYKAHGNLIFNIIDDILLETDNIIQPKLINYRISLKIKTVL